MITKTWEKLYPDEEFVAPDWIRHDPIKLRIKPQWANTTARAETEAARMEVDEDEIEEEDAHEDSSAGYAPPSTEPSWAKKLKAKMKALFCMQAKGQYRTHVASKESCRRDKRILRTFGEDITSGSEKHITPEAEWMAKQGYKWTDSEEEPIPAAESDGERASDYSTCVVGVLSAFLAPRCQRGRVCRICEPCVVFVSFAFVPLNLVCFGLVCACETFLSYGVRHMHSIVPY